MGSLNLFKTAEDYYCLGLWLADGYWWSSSIGLSSTNKIFLARFEKFLKKVCPTHPIKERFYKPMEGYKRRLIAKHVYVNSRPLTREFMEIKYIDELAVPLKFIPSYLAGRIDGDGHVDKKHRTGIRIVYGNKEDAVRDLCLLKKLNDNPASLYRYERANTWVLYFKKSFLNIIQPKIAKFAYKLNIYSPVETSVVL